MQDDQKKFEMLLYVQSFPILISKQAQRFTELTLLCVEISDILVWLY
jgi:hypothetical protein